MHTENYYKMTIMNSASGFTLLEVMIAICIMSFGMVGMWLLQIQSIQNGTSSTYRAIALNHAQEHMEDILNASFTNAYLSDLNPSNNTDLMSTGSVDYQNVDLDGTTIDAGKFTIIRNIASNSPIANTMTIVVIVTWQEVGKGSRSLNLSVVKSLTS